MFQQIANISTKSVQCLNWNVSRRWLHFTCSNCRKKKFQTEEDVEMMPEFVYIGDHHKSGVVAYTWGNTLDGAIGKASYIRPDKKKKQFVFKFVWKPHRLGFSHIFQVKDIACGYGFTVLAVDKEDDKPTCFGTGNNTDGQIGYHDPNKGKPLQMLIQPFSLKPPISNKEYIRKVAAGRAHTLMLSNNHQVYSVGNNAYGQCGRPIIEEEDYLHNVTYHCIKEVEGYQIAQLECGQDNSFILTTCGKLYSCGWSADGQTGRGHYNNESNVGLVKGDLEGENIIKVSCRADCALALNDKGEVFGWGNSEYRQLMSITDEKQVNIPKRLPLPTHLGKIKDVAASGSSCFVVTESGELYSWGYGHLGCGKNYLFSEQPMNIPLTLFGANVLSPDSKVSSVTCGINNVAVINSMGSLYMWGKNASGNLGLGYLDTQYFPLRVSLLGKVKKVCCGTDHTAAIVQTLI